MAGRSSDCELVVEVDLQFGWRFPSHYELKREVEGRYGFHPVGDDSSDVFLWGVGLCHVITGQVIVGSLAFGQERSLEVLPRAVAATPIYAHHIVDGDAVDLFANKPRILGDEVWSADSSLRRSDPG